MNQPVDLVHMTRNERRSYLALLDPVQRKELLKQGFNVYMEEHLKDVFPGQATSSFSLNGIKSASINAEAQSVMTLSLECWLTLIKEEK